ncbi:hypothetical protein COLSTE_01979 [Collinsella stercoris DSM 13279]|uniref:Uncharacterized protein n=1 Tax=Collinsella stercoris DSM 13279 TaxID=445975 RepID=B6GD01_9ACTN|nr:hypothetical protein COLSTE_01979 [Collinsella stercoris DSM 13279]
MGSFQSERKRNAARGNRARGRANPDRVFERTFLNVSGNANMQSLTALPRHRVFQVPEIGLKEEGARLACGARRLKTKVERLGKPS